MVSRTDHFVVCEICGTHVGDSADYSFVKSDAVYFGSYKDSGGMICLRLYSLNPSLAHSSETLLPVQSTICRYIPENSIVDFVTC